MLKKVFPLRPKLRRISSLVRKLSPYPKKVNLLAVSSAHPIEEIQSAALSGIKYFGETDLNEATKKFEAMDTNRSFKLHFIGKLPSNKVRRALQIFDCIESVDNFKLAEKINRLAREVDKKVPVYIQINPVSAPNFPGFTPEILESNLPPILRLPNLSVQGFLINAPVIANQTILLRSLKKTRQIAKKFSLPKLSANFHENFSLAVKEGIHLIHLDSPLLSP